MVCVILSGGKSSRMGCDKSLIPFGDCASLAEFMLKKMRDFGLFECVFLSVKDAEKYDFEADFLIETSSVFGPLVGILNAFESLKEREIFFISVDAPMVSLASIKQILNASGEIVFAKTPSKKHFLIAKWNRAVLPALRMALDSKNYRIGDIVALSKSHPVEFTTESEFINLNTIEDVKKALHISATSSQILDKIPN